MAPPPQELVNDCADPILIPEPAQGEKLPQLQAESLWARDRRNLIECGETKQALIDFYQSRDNRIQAR